MDLKWTQSGTKMDPKWTQNGNGKFVSGHTHCAMTPMDFLVQMCIADIAQNSKIFRKTRFFCACLWIQTGFLGVTQWHFEIFQPLFRSFPVEAICQLAKADFPSILRFVVCIFVLHFFVCFCMWRSKKTPLKLDSLFHSFKIKTWKQVWCFIRHRNAKNSRTCAVTF